MNDRMAPGESAMEARSPARRRIAIIFNPAAGRRRRRRLEQVLKHLRRADLEIVLHATRVRGDAERFARDIAIADSPDDRFDMLVAAGGDGTIGEVVNGLMSVPDAARRPPLALVPLGTANVLATEIGLGKSPRAATAAISGGIPRPIYIGTVCGRCFTMMVGAGFDAQAVATVDLDLKRRIGWVAYVVATAKVALRYGSPRYRVEADGQAYEAASVIVSKGRYYGGPFLLAPDARLDQPEFHVCLFERDGTWHSIRYGLALLLGILPRLSGYRIVTGRSILVDGPAGAPLQGDGDLIGTVPARIELSATTLTLMLPPAVA
ncbi:MAG: diacylglycerol/lipid kinase family protein [Dongiaceae bacterium]